MALEFLDITDKHVLKNSVNTVHAEELLERHIHRLIGHYKIELLMENNAITGLEKIESKVLSKGLKLLNLIIKFNAIKVKNINLCIRTQEFFIGNVYKISVLKISK